MTTQHTPGPWHLEMWEYPKRPPHTFPEIVVRTHTDAIAKVCDLWAPDERIEEQRANARLIAAAPMLLDALRDLIERAEAEYTPEQMNVPEYNTARAAIATATGGTEQ